MVTPKPHQIVGAEFLAERNAALLADEPRVGKTGAAIMACDMVFATKILVVTTASARANWAREFREWSSRTAYVAYGSKGSIPADSNVVVVGWDSLSELAQQLRARTWDVIIYDEAHYGKNPEAKRTIAAFGMKWAATYRWCLTGTPYPNAPADIYPMLRALAPERLLGVLNYDNFVDTYCTWYPKRLRFNTIRVITGGKNLADLTKRLEGFMLRRTQQDVGIGRPIFALHSLHVTSVPADIREPGEAQDILDAAETGETRGLEMHLGPIRRITGQLKAGAAAKTVMEELDDGLDKIVLMAWHTDVIDALKILLKPYGVVGVDGRTPADKRDSEVQAFQKGSARVFVGQIQAAGEGIDLSAACELMFVEYSFVPKDMAQAALRITNFGQRRQTRVRVCALEGSIDEAFARILTRKVETIKTLQGASV